MSTMKKRIPVFLLALAMLLLCALCFCSCNSNPLTNETPDTSSVKHHNDSDELFLITDVDGFMNKSHTYNSDGMYEVVRATDSSWANIYYTDFNSCSRQILCNEPACAHNNDSCRSYIKDAGMLYGLFIFNDNLFIYTNASNEYPVIFQAGLDGSDRKTFFNFSQADSPDGAIAANSTSWYYLHQDIDSTGDVVESIQCLDTISKRVQTLYTLPQSNEIAYYLAGAYNNELIIKTNSFSPETPTGIYSYNITTNHFTPIIEATGNIVCRVADEALVYWQSNQPQIIRHDLRSGTETVLYEDSLLNSYASLLVSGIFDEHLVMIISSSTPLEEADWNAVSPEEKLRWKATLEDALGYEVADDLLYDELIRVNRENNAGVNISQSEYVAVDLHGGGQQITLKGGESHALPVTILAETPNKFCVYYDYEDVPITLYNNEGTPYTSTYRQMKTAMIGTDDFFANNPNYSYIQNR